MTKREKRWLDAICQLGCIICLLFLRVFSPAEPHHLLSGGRRRGHLFTIPLCPLHHRSGLNNHEVTSRDQCRKRFEERYGTEDSLLAKTRELVQEKYGISIAA